MVTKLGAHKLRKTRPTQAVLSKIRRNPIFFVLDQIVDTYNIGSLFRLADAIAAEKVYLCGDIEYPPSSRIHKAAVGTESWVPWVRYNSASDAVRELKQNGVQIIAIEQDKRSVSYTKIEPKFPIALVLGNETTGIDKAVLDEADSIVELPMYGINKSFNVWGSAAVVAYKILEKLPAG